MHYSFAVLALALCCPNAAWAKSSGSGIEYVKACDSSSDDVTNQCINRIPEDVGLNSGNHACAYHEAEVKCLGLCGNTVTWKVAYMNALKRYRLVCANYIDERLAEKEEEVDSGGGDSSPPPPIKKKVGSDSGGSGSQKSKKGGSALDSELDAAKAIAKKAESHVTSSAVAKANKPASTPLPATTAAQKTINVDLDKLKPATGQPLDEHKTKQPQQSVHKSDDSDPMRKELKDHAQAMLPTMDPEVAAAPIGATPLTLTGSFIVLIVASLSVF
ncbi:hypothetical protein IWW38_003615 [Coemansia aciculifera]|uniref:Uncharacterized protein n=1 Tax=Coemansia aciculifera TaxID=417176 RepID=A0ACC1M0T9_9FUNG|nr:hypothetical protein IWW38_003615 [Coemansia aciculifera]